MLNRINELMFFCLPGLNLTLPEWSGMSSSSNSVLYLHLLYLPDFILGIFSLKTLINPMPFGGKDHLAWENALVKAWCYVSLLIWVCKAEYPSIMVLVRVVFLCLMWCLLLVFVAITVWRKWWIFMSSAAQGHIPLLLACSLCEL